MQYEPRGTISLDDTLAALAHELRGQLQVLALNAETTAARVRSQASAIGADWLLERLERQLGATRFMQQLMDSLLCAQQAGSGPRRAHVDLTSLVADVMQADADTLSSAQCACSLVAPDPVPGFWDALQLRIAIGNLIGNAAKYGAGHPVEVTVGAEDDLAFVRVRDHGIGVDPHDRQRIFERFTRSPSASHMSGFGLGLWLVRSIAHAHGGDVGLLSAKGEGATFTLTLPRAPAAPDSS